MRKVTFCSFIQKKKKKKKNSSIDVFDISEMSNIDYFDHHYFLRSVCFVLLNG